MKTFTITAEFSLWDIDKFDDLQKVGIDPSNAFDDTGDYLYMVKDPDKIIQVMKEAAVYTMEEDLQAQFPYNHIVVNDIALMEYEDDILWTMNLTYPNVVVSLTFSEDSFGDEKEDLVRSLNRELGGHGWDGLEFWHDDTHYQMSCYGFELDESE